MRDQLQDAEDRFGPLVGAGVPNFIVLGTHKAGTTSLYRYLAQHPDVFVPELKEPNFFSYDDTIERHRNQVKQKTRVATATEYLSLFRGARPDQKVGEVSTDCFHSSLAPARIKRYCPALKMIVCLRNPVERAYSQYLMGIRHGNISPASADSSGRDAYWITGSLYAEALQRYMEIFPTGQLHVIIFEDLARNTGQVMRDLFEFIGVNPNASIDTSTRFNQGGIPRSFWIQRTYDALKSVPGLKRYTPFALRKHISKVRDRNLRKADPLPDNLRRQWLQFFEKDIARTEQLLGRDLGHWKR